MRGVASSGIGKDAERVIDSRNGGRRESVEIDFEELRGCLAKLLFGESGDGPDFFE